MQMNRGVSLMTNFVLALCLAGTATQKQEVGGEPEISTAKLVNTIRFLGATEVTYRGSNGRFASQEELLAFFRQKDLLGKSPLDLENPAPYQVQITTDPDGTRHQITIKRPSDRNDNHHGAAQPPLATTVGLSFWASQLVAPPHLNDLYGSKSNACESWIWIRRRLVNLLTASVAPLLCQEI